MQARQSRGGRLQIGVRDNGPGVPPGLERQIFLPFFSAREGGQGIGLTVVRQLVNGMGGRVRHVRPHRGRGGVRASTLSARPAQDRRPPPFWGWPRQCRDPMIAGWRPVAAALTRISWR